MEINSVNVVEKNLVPKSQTKPFYIGTKEAPSEIYKYKKKILWPYCEPVYVRPTEKPWGHDAALPCLVFLMGKIHIHLS